MRRSISAAVGAFVLTTAAVIPAGPARADAFRNDQWYLRTLKISQAHAISTGVGVTVAVIDTGTYPHPDLKRNLLNGIDELAGATGDGRDDQDGHGTNMSAIIAAHGRNGNDGVLGIAPSAKLLPVKIANKKNNMPANLMAKGVEWASNEGANVINVSAGGALDFGLEDAVNKAIENDIVVVAAVGNTSKGFLIGDPAAIDGVLAVGAVGRDGNHASLSLTDPKVQLCAPGMDITTAQPKNRYIDGSGTSEATAVVSGAAALVRAKFPQLSAKDVINRLTATADDIGPPGRDSQCGFGALNIVKALTADVPPLAGSASASPRATATDVPATAAPTTPGSAPPAAQDAKPTGSSAPVVVGAVVFGLALVGVVLFLANRRRRGSA
jgi:type VII secretion-associated serine protease mycosin